MVSKVAVIALVAIIAVPILVGYGLNFETESYSYYSATGSETNVTPLLQNSTTYNYTNANPYSLNADILTSGNSTGNFGSFPTHYLPRYQSFIDTPTSMPLNTGTLGTGDNFSSVYLLQIDNRAAGISSTLTTTIQYTQYGSTQTSTVYKTTMISYDRSDDILFVTGNVTSTGNPTYTYAYLNPISTSYSGAVHSDAYIVRANASTNKYVDITAGWTISNGSYPSARVYEPPAPAQSILFTMNLDAVSNSESQIYFNIGTNDPNTPTNRISFERVVNGSDVSWYAFNGNQPVSSRVQIPYNPDIPNNTVQFNITRAGCDLRYIGSWQNTIGEANYYWSNYFDWQLWSIPDTAYITRIVIGTPGNVTTDAVFRVDAASILATTLPVILDNTFDPVYSTNHTNPATTVKDVQKYGTSFTFGGQTFNVTNGTFTIGTSNPIPVDGMKLDSIPDGNGNYDNRINGTKISTTATPSAITFNGQWRANVSTVSQEEVVKADTHWVAGKFAWQGLDDNFLMVGLLTSAAAFVGLAMYGKKSGAKVGALLLVCGGAAFMFILMM